YRAVVLRFPQMEVARQALEDLYLIDEVSSEEELRRLVATGQVGLLLIGAFGSAREESERLNVILSDVERQPPIVYMGKTSSPELETLISKSGRLVFKNTDFGVLELRTLAQRMVEVYVLAFENQRLTSELERALERLRRENQYLKGRIVQPMRIEGLIGDSTAMRRVYD